MSAGAVLLPTTTISASGTAALGSPAASGTTGVAGQSVGLDVARIDQMVVMLVCGTSSAGTLNMYLQHSVDGGTTWQDFISFAQVTTGGSTQFAQWLRGQMMTAGTAPANTAGVNAHLAKSLTAGSVITGPVGDNWQLAWTVGSAWSGSVKVTARQILRTR